MIKISINSIGKLIEPLPDDFLSAVGITTGAATTVNGSVSLVDSLLKTVTVNDCALHFNLLNLSSG
ncbi:MAG: hypothetical protein ACJAUK_000634 [Colwellia polaris]|jgi:hypothetical protein